MALVKTTLSLISKLKKEILHVFFPTLRRRDTLLSTYENDSVNINNSKAIKLELVLSHYQPLTWV